MDGSLSLGEVATELSVLPPDGSGHGALRLYYENGSECASGGRITSTIDFTCGMDFGSPRYVGFLEALLPMTLPIRRLVRHVNRSLYYRALAVTEPCKREFVWETIAACSVLSRGTPCKAVNEKGELFNMSPLQNVPFDWLYADNDGANPTRYYLGVCRPLEGHYPDCDKA
jgi:hypothetical protein